MVFKIPNRLLKKLEEQYKPESIKKFTFTLKKIFKELFKTEKYDTATFKGRSSDFKKYVEDNIPEKQRHPFSFIVYKMMLLDNKKIGKRDMEKYKDINYKFKIAYSASNKSDDELQNKEVITMDELMDIRNKYDAYANDKPENKTLQLGRLLLYFYTEIPPLRSQDLINTIYDDKPNDDELNYLDLKKRVLHIVAGKSKNSIRDITLPDTLVKIAKITKDRVGSNILFPNVRNITKHMTNSNFTHFFNNVLGKKISSSKLRNIIASKYYDDGMTDEQRAKLARDMGHSLQVNQTVYTKYSKLLHKSKQLMEENKKLKSDIKELKEQLNDIKNNN